MKGHSLQQALVRTVRSGRPVQFQVRPWRINSSYQYLTLNLILCEETVRQDEKPALHLLESVEYYEIQ